MKKKEFYEHDKIGETTLNIIAKAQNFNEWMYHTIKPFCKGKILEIGSGIGNISHFFLKDNFEIMLTDIRKGYCSKLKSDFSHSFNFLGAEIMNLAETDFDKKFKVHIGQYDTVFALNVIEHIQDDYLAIRNCNKLLKDGGQLIILVPSYQKLYNRFDLELGHCRRYNKSSLSKIFIEEKFEVIHSQYFNFIGILGWYISGSIFKKESIPKNQMKAYNLLVPFFKIIDKSIFNIAGLSVITVGRKKNSGW